MTSVALFGVALTVWELVLAVLVLLLGGFLKGTVGFAVGLVTLSGLVQLFPPKLAIVALSIPFLVSNVVVLAHDGVPWEFLRSQTPFLVMLVLGLLIGVVSLGVLSSRSLYLLLVVYIALFLLFQRYEEHIKAYANTKSAGAGAGILSGFLGGVVSAPGPPLVIHAYLNVEEGKRAFVTGVSSLFLVAHSFRILFLVGNGLMEIPEVTFGVLFSVPIYCGVFLGSLSRSHIDALLFKRLVKGLLAIIGFKLLLNGLGI